MSIASFSIIGLPSLLVAGSNTGLSVTITALDIDGDIDVGYTGTAKFTATDEEAFPVPLPYTFLVSDVGTKTLTAGTVLWPAALITSSPNLVVSVEDSLLPSISGTHTSFEILPVICPTCHSKIGTSSILESDRVQGKQGVDDNENPVPRWTDDPIFTPRGLSGTAYDDRHNNIKTSHIVELQDERKEQEEESGIPETLRTNFSDVTDETRITQRHIIELRESTEKILNVLGLTLEDYFKLDDNEVEQPQNPKIVGAGGDDPQTEWVDVERGATYFDGTGAEKSTFELPDGSTQDSPTVPARHPIRAIHIEDLRHPVTVGVSPAIVIMGSNKAFSAKLSIKKALFRQATPCGIEEP